MTARRPDTLHSVIAATTLDLATAVQALLLDGQSEDEVIDIRDAWHSQVQAAEPEHYM